MDTETWTSAATKGSKKRSRQQQQIGKCIEVAHDNNMLIDLSEFNIPDLVERKNYLIGVLENNVDKDLEYELYLIKLEIKRRYLGMQSY